MLSNHCHFKLKYRYIYICINKIWFLYYFYYYCYYLLMLHTKRLLHFISLSDMCSSCFVSISAPLKIFYKILVFALVRPLTLDCISLSCISLGIIIIRIFFTVIFICYFVNVHLVLVFFLLQP